MGSILRITGGMVSLGPPEGGVVVFAQEGEKSTTFATIKAGGSSGSSIFSAFAIFLFIISLS